MSQTSNLRSFFVLTAACVAFGGAEKSASAYYPFPGYVETHLKLTTLPEAPSGQGCELCHNNPNGGLNTATQPFGDLMRAHGIVYTSSEAQVDAALDAIAADPTYGGYIKDIENGVNPNTDSTLPQPGGASTTGVTPEYGCGATVARKGVPSDAGTGIVALAGAALGFVMRRRRQTPRDSK